MNLLGWQQRRRNSLRDEPRQLTLHHFGFDPQSLRHLHALLDSLTREGAVAFSLESGGGDVVLVDELAARTVPPQVLHAFCEGRPCVTVVRNPPRAGMVRGTIAAEPLSRSLRALVETMPNGGVAADPRPAPADRKVHLASPHSGVDSGFDSGFDSAFDSRLQQQRHLADKPLDPGRQQLLHRLHRAWRDADRAQICASYGPGQSILFDFAQRMMWAEPDALPCLRIQRELPYPAPETRLAGGSIVRDSDQGLWDLAVAAGPYALLDAPSDWWHTTIEPLAIDNVARLSNLPVQRELARAVADGGMTPSRLRRECRTSVNDVRCFLQACLYLGLVRWSSGASAPPESSAG